MHTLAKVAMLALPLASAIPHGDISSRSLISDLAKLVNLTNILPIPIDSEDRLQTALTNIRQQNFQNEVLETTFAALLADVVANVAPQDVQGALTPIATTLGNGAIGSSTIENIAEAILNGLAVTDLTQNVLAGYLSSGNSFSNVNPAPPTTIYPRKSPQDAPYTVPEAQLRAAVYIPPGFTYGAKQPICFVPGTGAFGYVNFISNLGKLFGNTYDPVYLNVPGAMYDDTQINSQYIAYMLNYISSITKRNDVAEIAWSQGNLDTQWVFQYWPSTRSVVTDFISASADFHGTTLAYFLDPALVNPPLPPSVIQQEYDSNFVLTLRRGGGGSPYVNSTSVHSISDQIVQPQYSPYASADYFTLDLPGTPNTNPTCPVSRNVPYTNTEIQTACAGRPAGGVYTHEGVLYNPLMYALALDALQNDGPGRLDRIDLNTVCQQLIAPGLTLADVQATEGLIPLAAVNLLLYPRKVTNEPAVMQYAVQANSACSASSTSSSRTSTSSSTTRSATGMTSTT
ncbi:hypothetical protein LTR64_002213 [Lithohypha guttulata]|uniref:uncharacterized protein n=1 Tax=Lithohypha guttulata TaxID=1690604 RepID=UPI002DE01A25|nr:hypothetical protein LTR51_001561 [Lithohypha guttulata]